MLKTLVEKYGRPAIFGTTDGLVCLVGVLLSLAHQPHLIFRTALGVGFAEMVGMSMAEALSDSEHGVGPSIAMGTASGAAAIFPAVPYLVFQGAVAVGVSLLLSLALATMVAVTRAHKRGWGRAFVETYVVLLVAAGAVALSQLFAPGSA